MEEILKIIGMAVGLWLVAAGIFVWFTRENRRRGFSRVDFLVALAFLAMLAVSFWPKANGQADPRTGMKAAAILQEGGLIKKEFDDAKNRQKKDPRDPLVSRREVCEKAREVLEVAKENFIYWCSDR